MNPGDNFGADYAYKIPERVLEELLEQMAWHRDRVAQYSADRDMLDREDALRPWLDSLIVAHAQARMGLDWALTRTLEVNGLDEGR